MPRALTHKSILLLARRRLSQIYRPLEAKARAGGPVTDLERRVAHLAHRAYEMLSVPPHPPLEGALALDPLAEGVSTYAVMGSMSPDFPAFAALMVEGNDWIFDTLHKGSPDFNREFVNVGSTDFALALWEKAVAAFARDFPTADPALDAATRRERERKRDEGLERMRAYVLGHLAHVAADALSHPWVNEIEWLAPPLRVSHRQVENALDAAVAQKVLGRSELRSGQSWDVWWPSAAEVPPQLHEGFTEALESVYGLRTKRRTGLAEFERDFAGQHPPALDKALIGSGYKLFRNGVIGIAYDWGWWHWFGILALFVVPVLAAPYTALATENGRKLFAPKVEGEDLALPLWELYTPPLTFGVAATLGYQIALSDLIGKGVEGFYMATSVAGGFAFFFSLIAAAIAFLGSSAGPAVRWSLLFALPALLWLVPALGSRHKPKEGLFVLVPLLPVIAALVYAAFSLTFLPFRDGASSGTMTKLTVLFLALWSVLWIVAWVWLSFVLRDREVSAKKRTSVSESDHPLRLFDDGSLYSEPQVAAPTLAQRFYPSGRRKLLKLWWEGTGAMSLRSDRFQLVFRSGAGVETTVRAPIEPTTLAGYLALLERTLPGLKGAIVEPTNLDYVLPPGGTFADHGEDDEDEPLKADEHAKRAAEMRPLGTSAESTKYVLYHAPKVVQSVRFGTFSPVDPTLPDFFSGIDYLHDELEDDGSRLMDHAADFAALLMLGGASRMMPEGARPVPNAGRIDPLQQVFRNWSLERRRVNEWRMLIAGGAFGEKGLHPEGRDPMMPADTPAAWTSPLFNPAARAPFDEGEAAARQLGWVPLLRKWLDVAARPNQNVLSDERFNPNDPPPHALSRGLAYLLDMTDPVPAP